MFRFIDDLFLIIKRLSFSSKWHFSFLWHRTLKSLKDWKMMASITILSRLYSFVGWKMKCQYVHQYVLDFCAVIFFREFVPWQSLCQTIHIFKQSFVSTNTMDYFQINCTKQSIRFRFILGVGINRVKKCHIFKIKRVTAFLMLFHTKMWNQNKNKNKKNLKF